MSESNSLPKNWRMLNLFSLCTIVKGKKPQKISQEKTLDSVPYVTIDSFQGNYKQFTDDLTGPQCTEQDVLMVMDGARSGLVATNVKGVIGSTLALLKLYDKNEIHPKYLFYFLDSKFDYLNTTTTGSAIPHVDKNVLRNLLLPLPSFSTQKKIVSILDKARDLKTKSEKTRKYADKLLPSTFLRMFGNPITNPNKWPVKKIHEFAQVGTGSTPKRNIGEFYGGIIPWIKTTEAKDNVIYESEERITQKGLDNSNTTIFPTGTVLIAMYGQGKTRGRTAKLGIEAATNQAFAAILPSTNHDSDYLWYLLRHSYNALRKMARGGNQPNLNLGMIKSLEIPFPPIKLQKEFSDIVNKFDKTQHRFLKSEKRYEDLFYTLTKKAFLGKLVN